MQTQLRTLATAAALTLSAAAAFAAPALMTVASDDFSSMPTGQLLLSGNNDSAATRTLNNSVSAAVRVEFDFSFSGVLSDNDFAALWFGSKDGPNIGLKANCGGGSGCTKDLFVRGSGTSGTFAPNNISSGTVYHLMGLLEKTGNSANYNSFKLWVDPTEAERVQLINADATSTLNSGLSSFDKIGFRTVNLANEKLVNGQLVPADRVSIDNLNISVVPEPASLALAGLGLGLLALTKRRRAI